MECMKKCIDLDMWSFWVESNLCRFICIVCLYMHCRWRSSFQKGMF